MILWSIAAAPEKVVEAKRLVVREQVQQRENCTLRSLFCCALVWPDWFGRQNDRWLCEGSQGVPWT